MPSNCSHIDIAKAENFDPQKKLVFTCIIGYCSHSLRTRTWQLSGSLSNFCTGSALSPLEEVPWLHLDPHISIPYFHQYFHRNNNSSFQILLEEERRAIWRSSYCWIIDVTIIQIFHCPASMPPIINSLQLMFVWTLKEHWLVWVWWPCQNENLW